MVKFGHAHFLSYNNHNTIKHLCELPPPCWLLQNGLLYTRQEDMSSNYAVGKEISKEACPPTDFTKGNIGHRLL